MPTIESRAKLLEKEAGPLNRMVLPLALMGLGMAPAAGAPNVPKEKAPIVQMQDKPSEPQDQTVSREEVSAALSNAATRTGVSLSILKGIAQNESSYGQNSATDADSAGFMQMTPRALSQVNKVYGTDYTSDDMADPDMAALASAQYVAHLTAKFNGNQDAAIAAYNAGPRNINNVLAEYGEITPETLVAAGHTRAANYLMKVQNSMNAKRRASLFDKEAGPGRWLRDAESMLLLPAALWGMMSPGAAAQQPPQEKAPIVRPQDKSHMEIEGPNVIDISSDKFPAIPEREGPTLPVDDPYMKRRTQRAGLFGKKGEVEVKQYGTPTPSNPMDQGKEDDEEELKIKKPLLPGQPGNPPGNNASNGPLMQRMQASFDMTAFKTLPPDVQDALKAMVTCSYCQDFLRLAIHSRLVKHLQESHGCTRDSAMTAAHEAYRRYDLHKRRQPNPAVASLRAKLLNKKAKNRGLNPPVTVEQMRAFFSNFPDVEQPVAIVSAVSTYPQIQLPIYEMWNSGGKPTISVDTDPFYEHIQSINKPRTPAKRGATHREMVEEAMGSSARRYPMGPKAEAIARAKANNELAILSRKYHSSMPIQEIRDILQKHGFNPEAMDGIYTGEDGKMHEQCGPKTWVAMTWHKLPRTGLWEIVAYVS